MTNKVLGPLKCKMRVIKTSLILVLILFFLSPIYVLEVKTDKAEELLYQQLASLGETFEIQWIHSVTLQPVSEFYRLEELNRIPLVKMIFDDNGPNLPARAEYEQSWIIEDGKFIVIGYDRIFERVPVRIGAVIADHILIYKDKQISLKDLYRPGGLVYIGLKKSCRAEYLAKEVKIWLKK